MNIRYDGVSKKCGCGGKTEWFSPLEWEVDDVDCDASNINTRSECPRGCGHLFSIVDRELLKMNESTVQAIFFLHSAIYN